MHKLFGRWPRWISAQRLHHFSIILFWFLSISQTDCLLIFQCLFIYLCCNCHPTHLFTETNWFLEYEWEMTISVWIWIGVAFHISETYLPHHRIFHIYNNCSYHSNVRLYVCRAPARTRNVFSAMPCKVKKNVNNSNEMCLLKVWRKFSDVKVEPNQRYSMTYVHTAVTVRHSCYNLLKFMNWIFISVIGGIGTWPPSFH